MNKSLPGTLTIATCQFAVSGDPETNLVSILEQMQMAKSKGAEIVHFCESSLSGYAGVDFPEINRSDKLVLENAVERIKSLAREIGIWVILGSHHFNQKGQKPYNCLFIINDKGEIVDRYDKRLLAVTNEENEIDHYSPGEKPVVFTINDIPCGLLICHEWRYPELYREYYKRKVKILFQSWYDGNLTPEKYITYGKELGELIIATVRGNAASNHLWVSGSNTCKKESSFPSFMVRPDGMISNKLPRNRPGILISHIDLAEQFTDSSCYHRDRVIRDF